MILDHVDHGNVLNPILLEKGIRSLIGVPLLVKGMVIGVLHVGSIGSRVFTGDDAGLLQLAAERAAPAVQSFRSRDDRAAAAALQRRLLLSDLPVVPGTESATRYVPGDGRVGDVACSGLQAAIIMGRMRSALRAYALETRDPAEVLTRLDRKMQHFEPEAIATIAYAVLTPDTGDLAIASAGHFAPVIAVPGRPSAPGEMSIGVPIGVADDPVWQTTTMSLTPGTLLFLFTDGLIERRHTPIDDRLALLSQTVAADPPESVCASVMRVLVGREPVGDDIALLALRWSPPQPEPIAA